MRRICTLIQHLHPIQQLNSQLEAIIYWRHPGLVSWRRPGLLVASNHPGGRVLAASWLRPGSFQVSWLCAGVLATFRHPGGRPDSVLHLGGIQAGSWQLQMACGVLDGSPLTRRVLATSVGLAGGGISIFWSFLFTTCFKNIL